MADGEVLQDVCEEEWRFGRVILRSYQERAISDLRAQYAAGKRAPCLVLPTGAGKTVIAASIIRSAVARKRRVLFLVHRTELQSQSVAKLENAGVTDLRIIKAGQDIGSREAPVTVASIPTLTRWENLPAADLVVFDECHHVVAKTWARIATAYQRSHLLGMTATPQRADGKPLGDIFDSIVVGATVRELIELGHLVPCRVWAPQTPPDSGEIAFDPAEAYRLHARGQRAVIFCVTVDHAEQVAAAMPVPTRVVHGEMSAKDRAAALRDFADGRVLALANVHVLTEGFDCPAATVCILTRKPEHAGTYLQCLDSATQVLTQRGWMGPDEIRDDDLVASIDASSSEATWQPILSRVDRPLGAGEKMYSLESPHLDIRVTGGHRILFKQRTMREKRRIEWPREWKLATAAEVSGIRASYRVPVGGHQEAAGLPLSDDEIRFIGWFLTDGTLNRRTRQVVIYQSEHQPQIHELRACLAGCKFDWKEYRRDPKKISGSFPNGKPQIAFHIAKGTGHGRQARRGWNKLADYLDKSFAPALENLDERQLGILLEAIHLGDGSKQRNQDWIRRSYHISTGSRLFADRLQSLCVRRGFRCNVARHNNGILFLHIKPGIERSLAGAIQGRPAFVECNSTPGERVWCVETPLGTIITRRNGKVAVVGNCVGRVLRPAPGKSEAILLDLGGSVWTHGTPDAERAYTLDGEGISRTDEDRLPVRQCTTCGGVFLQPQDGMCPQCGVQLPYKPVKPPRSNGSGISEVTGGVVTPADVLRMNLERVARRTKRTMDWVERAHTAIIGRKFGWR